jgi:hypothetical protein
MFFSSRGHFDAPPGTTVATDERLSAAGWQGCASCHFEGLTDGVVWVFGAGPRKSVPLNASFDPADPSQQRILNYSAIFDEVEDFELNVRNVSGPGPAGGANDPNHGLLFDDDGDINLAPAVINAFALPNEGRNEFTVTLPSSTTAVPALTALREWVRFAVRTPNGPLDASEIDGGPTPVSLARGRALFEQAGCQTCHGGTDWTLSIKDFDSPPDPTEVFTETNPPPNFGNPIGVQYLDRFLAEVGSFNAGVAGEGNPIGKDVGAPELANAAPDAQGQLNLPDGLGIDYNGDGAGDGFSIPSLLGAHGTQPYLHNGACESLVCVLESSAHRTAGNPTDVINTKKKRNKVARFVESIDDETEPF